MTVDEGLKSELQKQGVYITTFDQIARVGPDIFDSEMKAKYRLAVGLLAKMGPDGVNFVTMRE